VKITCVLGPFLPVPTVRGGAVEKIWLALCRELAGLGHDVTLISRRYGNLPEQETVDRVRYLRVPSFDAPRSRPIYRFLDIVYALRVCRVLPSSDVTVTNSVFLPLVIPRRRAGAIYVSVARFPKGQMGWYRRADRLQAVSEVVAEAIRRQAPALATRVRTLPNALAEEFFAAPPSGECGPREAEILYVGRIAREKGIDLLIRSFARVAPGRDWCLTILGPAQANAGGDGPDFLSALREMAADLGGRVRFEEPIFDDRQLALRLRRAAIFVYPSIAEQGESFGMAPLEAMACGCAVIVSSLTCFRDFVEPDCNAITFDHRQDAVRNLAICLERLMDHPGLRADLAREGAKGAQRFRASEIAQRFALDFASLSDTPDPSYLPGQASDAGATQASRP
jgi:glycosyltransferase involved in cell wall biosynthesis